MNQIGEKLNGIRGDLSIGGTVDRINIGITNESTERINVTHGEFSMKTNARRPIASLDDRSAVTLLADWSILDWRSDRMMKHWDFAVEWMMTMEPVAERMEERHYQNWSNIHLQIDWERPMDRWLRKFFYLILRFSPVSKSMQFHRDAISTWDHWYNGRKWHFEDIEGNILAGRFCKWSILSDQMYRQMVRHRDRVDRCCIRFVHGSHRQIQAVTELAAICIWSKGTMMDGREQWREILTDRK